MVCKREIHENDLNTEFIVRFVECDVNGNIVPVDISSATVKQIKFLRPDGSTLTVDGSFTQPASGGAGNGTDGKLSYFSQAGDLSPAGRFKIQGYVELPSGAWSSTVARFTVKENI